MVEGGPCQGERSKRVWPDEKLTHINFESMSILKHPSLNKTRDFERGAWLPYCSQFLLFPSTSLSEAWSLLF